jgi:hypothetical protein
MTGMVCDHGPYVTIITRDHVTKKREYASASWPRIFMVVLHYRVRSLVMRMTMREHGVTK